METKKLPELVSRIAQQPMLAVALCRTSTISSPMIVSNDWLLDQRALLRWADDGGRWAEESNAAIRKVTI